MNKCTEKLLMIQLHLGFQLSAQCQLEEFTYLHKLLKPDIYIISLFGLGGSRRFLMSSSALQYLQERKVTQPIKAKLDLQQQVECDVNKVKESGLLTYLKSSSIL